MQVGMENGTVEQSKGTGQSKNTLCHELITVYTSHL